MAVITIPYKPFPLQQYLHEHLKRFNVLVCHRRFGKSVFAVNEIIRKALTCKEKHPQYAYIAPTQKQAKLIIWDYFKQFLKAVPDVKFNESELRITLPNDAKIFVLGAENPDNLRGLYLDGVVMDEVAQMPAGIWEKIIRPALSDRQGWGIFIGTPEGQNEFYRMYLRAKSDPEWFSAIFKLSNTTKPNVQLTSITWDEMQRIKREYKGREEDYMQEYECSFTAAIKGTYYTKILGELDADGHFRRVPWDPDWPVITSWDIGINDKTCIWFAQDIAGEIRVIDYYEETGETLGHYANVVKSKPYTYDYHILPHDVMQRSIQTGRTRYDTLKNLGLDIRVAPRISIEDGINAVIQMLPKCWFDVDKCDKGLRALMNYRSQYDKKSGTFKKIPVHDEYSHAADAFRYLAIGMKSYKETQAANRFKNGDIEDQIITDYDPLSY